MYTYRSFSRIKCLYQLPPTAFYSFVDRMAYRRYYKNVGVWEYLFQFNSAVSWLNTGRRNVDHDFPLHIVKGMNDAQLVW